MGGPTGGPDEALPNLVGAAGPAGLRLRVGCVLLFCASHGSRSKTEFIDFAGRRARTAPACGLLFPDFQVHGSRSKTEFFGFAGRCARTAPAGGLLFPDFQVRSSRSKTEFFGFTGRRARTAPAGGLLFRIFRSTVRARKPSSLALRAGVREPHRPAGSFFGFSGPRFALENRVH